MTLPRASERPADPEIVADAPDQSKPQDKPKTKSLNYVMKYQKKEVWSFILGMFFLIGGSASDLLAPLYIGRVITALEADDTELVGQLCL